MNDQQVQAMRALAAQGDRGVSVGACGPRMYNPNGEGLAPAQLGQGGYPVGPMGGCAPMVPMATNLAQPCSVVQECFAPLGFAFGVDGQGNCYPESQIGLPLTGPGLTPAPFVNIFPRKGIYFILGIKFFNDPNEVIVTAINSGDSDINWAAGPFDCAAYNTDACFCPAQWGCASTTNPLRFQARAVGAPDVVVGCRGTCWGTSQSSLYGCTPPQTCSI